MVKVPSKHLTLSFTYFGAGPGLGGVSEIAIYWRTKDIKISFTGDRTSTEYNEYLDDDSKGKIEEFLTIGKTPINEIPEILKYKPVMISNIKFKSLGSINLQEIIVEKLKQNYIENNK